eukprot:9282375-Ditylum_brightwellii.AAC.1
MEAEYIALAHSMRELLPTKWLVDYLAGALSLEWTSKILVLTALEDNNGALILANNLLPQTTPRSKHIG